MLARISGLVCLESKVDRLESEVDGVQTEPDSIRIVCPQLPGYLLGVLRLGSLAQLAIQNVVRSFWSTNPQTVHSFFLTLVKYLLILAQQSYSRIAAGPFRQRRPATPRTPPDSDAQNSDFGPGAGAAFSPARALQSRRVAPSVPDSDRDSVLCRP